MPSPTQKLVAHAKKAVVKYNRMRRKNGGIDTLYAFVMSESGKIYDGACLETDVGHSSVCGERHAIANMVMAESYKAKIKCVVVADPVPKVQKNCSTPCGTCRHLIWSFGRPDTIVIGMQYMQKGADWVFPKTEQWTIKELYPNAYVPVEW